MTEAELEDRRQQFHAMVASIPLADPPSVRAALRRCLEIVQKHRDCEEFAHCVRYGCVAEIEREIQDGILPDDPRAYRANDETMADDWAELREIGKLLGLRK